MSKRIISASAFLSKNASSSELCPIKGINLVHGKNAEEFLQILSDLFNEAATEIARSEKAPHNKTTIFDGANICVDFTETRNKLQNKLYAFISATERHPIFIKNFLERLDEADDLTPVFETLASTERQVFIAVPHYYQIAPLEDMPYAAKIFEF